MRRLHRVWRQPGSRVRATAPEPRTAPASMGMRFRHSWLASIMTLMNYEYFQNLLSARPFQPFVVQLSSGDIHPVRYPSNAILTRTRMVIADPDADQIVVCSLLHIVKVELFTAPAPASPVGPAA